MIRTSVIETCIKYYLPTKSKVDILEMIIQMTKAKEKYEFSEVESAYLVFRWIIRNIKLEGPEGNKDPAIVYNSGQGSSLEYLLYLVEYVHSWRLDLILFQEI